VLNTGGIVMGALEGGEVGYSNVRTLRGGKKKVQGGVYFPQGGGKGLFKRGGIGSGAEARDREPTAVAEVWRT